MTNEERRLHIIKLIKKYQEDRKIFIKKLIKKHLKILEVELKDAAYFAVENYYSYETEYHRKHSLYDAYRIKVDTKKNIISVEFRPDFPGKKDIEGKHPGKGNYIYEWMFGGDIEDPAAYQGGWHGGDIDGPGHPQPGTPWLRSGIPVGTTKNNKTKVRFVPGDNNWLRPASRTESPYIEILNALQEVTSERQKLVQEEYDEFNEKRFSVIEKQIQIYVRGGGNQ